MIFAISPVAPLVPLWFLLVGWFVFCKSLSNDERHVVEMSRIQHLSPKQFILSLLTNNSGCYSWGGIFGGLSQCATAEKLWPMLLIYSSLLQ